MTQQFYQCLERLHRKWVEIQVFPNPISFMLLSFSFSFINSTIWEETKEWSLKCDHRLINNQKPTMYGVNNSLFKWSPITSDFWYKVVCKMRQSWSQLKNRWVEILKSYWVVSCIHDSSTPGIWEWFMGQSTSLIIHPKRACEADWNFRV